MKRNRKIIYLAGFLFSFPVALTSYINSSLLDTYVNEYYVSIIYVVASIITIFGMLRMPHILERFGNRKTTLWLCIILFFSLLGLAFGAKNFIIIAAFFLYWISASFIIATIDIFMEDFSQSKAVGRFRGFYISVSNIAWVLAQMISGSIIAKSSFKGIYLLSALFMVLVALVFVLFLKDFEDPKYKKVSMIRAVKLFFKNKNLAKIYFIDLVIKFFYAWMVIYTPIYLHHYLGLGWGQIGFIFTIMLLPFVLLSFPLGKLSDKIGEKKIMVFGFAVMSVATFMIPFITGSSVLVWTLALLATRIGAASAEAVTESYFFKVVSEENADLIAFFRNTSPLSYIIGPLLAIPILYYIPHFNYLFYILSAIVLLGFFVTLRLKDVK